MWEVGSGKLDIALRTSHFFVWIPNRVRNDTFDTSDTSVEKEVEELEIG